MANSTDFENLGKLKASQFEASYAEFASSNVDVALLIEAMLSIQGILFLFDYSYRAFQTVRMLSLFWRKSVVILPEADLRTNRAEITAKWFIYIAYFFELLPFFYLQILLLFTFVLIIVWAVTGIVLL